MLKQEDVITALVSEIKKRGGNEEDLYGLGMPDGETLCGQVADLVVQRIHNIYRVTIDYDMSIEEMKIAGDYDSENKDITIENFIPPVGGWGSGRVDVNVHLICFGMFMSYSAVLRKFASGSLRHLHPGNLPVLLALGAKYKLLQMEFPIIQIGSVWLDNGCHRGVYLRRAKKERMLSKVWLDHGLNGYYRIIAVEKYEK